MSTLNQNLSSDKWYQNWFEFENVVLYIGHYVKTRTTSLIGLMKKMVLIFYCVYNNTQHFLPVVEQDAQGLNGYDTKIIHFAK